MANYFGKSPTVNTEAKMEDGIHFGSDLNGTELVYFCKNGQLVASMPAKDWHEQEFEALTPIEQIPNSLEEWCKEIHDVE